jgi:hypothetical protein
MVAHDGGIPGISTRVAFLPQEGLGFVLLSNNDAKNDALGEIIDKIGVNILGLQPVDSNPRKFDQ